MTVSAVRPWRKALRRERSLPSGVVGPVLLSALRRLASICLSELIDDQQKNWVCFVVERAMPIGVARYIAITLCRSIPIYSEPPSVFSRYLGIFIGLTVVLGRGFGCVCSHSPLATGRASIFRFSHQVTSF